jgi:hypothetical protein
MNAQTIAVGTAVTRKDGSVQGIVTKTYTVCSHKMREHVGRECFSCTFKPRAFALVNWSASVYRLNGEQGNATATAMPMSRLTAVGAE